MKLTNPLAIVAAIAVLGFSPANAEIAVVVHSSSSTSSLTNDQVADIFLGKSNLLAPVNQAEGSNIRNDFFMKVANKDASQVKAIWTKLIFTGKSVPPKEANGSSEVKKLLSDDRRSIGYIDKSAVDSTVKVVLTLP